MWLSRILPFHNFHIPELTGREMNCSNHSRLMWGGTSPCLDMWPAVSWTLVDMWSDWGWSSQWYIDLLNPSCIKFYFFIYKIQCDNWSIILCNYSQVIDYSTNIEMCQVWKINYQRSVFFMSTSGKETLKVVPINLSRDIPCWKERHAARRPDWHRINIWITKWGIILVTWAGELL